MRRMYSQAELSAIIKEVFLEDVADGQIDLPALVTDALAEIDWSELELDCKSVTADSIIEKMSGYSFVKSGDTADYENDYQFASICKNGNKLTIVLFVGIKTLNALSIGTSISLGVFTLPADVCAKLHPYVQGGFSNALACNKVYGVSGSFIGIDFVGLVNKINDTQIALYASPANTTNAGTTYLTRFEFTFLLSENLIPSGE